jgi:hypothetical protein
MGEGATHLSTHTLGTITHQCPELIRTGRLSKPADAFSFGVVSESSGPPPHRTFPGRHHDQPLPWTAPAAAHLAFALHASLRSRDPAAAASRRPEQQAGLTVR